MSSWCLMNGSCHWELGVKIPRETTGCELVKSMSVAEKREVEKGEMLPGEPIA